MKNQICLQFKFSNYYEDNKKAFIQYLIITYKIKYNEN